MACNSRQSERIGDFAAGALNASEAAEILTHVEECPACSEEFDLVAALLHKTQPPPLTLFKNRSWLVRHRLAVGLAASILAVISIVYGTNLGDETSNETHLEIASLAELDPLPRPSSTLRGSGNNALEDELESALQSYTEGNYADAASSLQKVLARNPDHPLPNLYLGISLTQMGSYQEAVTFLARCAKNSEGLLQERALWYQANAHLKLEELDPARSILTRILAIEGDYEINASEKLLQIMGQAGAEE